jgi:hypothetical protein
MESSRFGVNASYVEALRAQWMQDPSSVAEEWSRFFADEGGVAVTGLLSSNNGHGQNGHATVMPATSLPRHAQLTEIDRWEVEQLAYLAGRLAAIDEGNGKTALDDTLVVFGSEIEDGNSHSHSNLPVVVVGHGGGVAPGGRHVRHARGTPIANLFSTVLQSFGAPTTFADSTGALTLT